jgi:uncharacterized SAM-binding protein YcdF (DUF218 family)
MFFLKKIAGYMLSPLSGYLLLCLLSMYYLWRRKSVRIVRILVTACLIFFIILSYGLLFKSWIGRLERRYRPISQSTDLGMIKWVVVLGAGMSSDQSLPLTSQLTEGSQIRTIEGIRLWRKTKAAKLIFSGGAVFNVQSEAKGMADLAKELGVPDSSIILEDNSLDTDDQSRLIKEMVKNDKILLVTSAIHMPRSSALFSKAGIDFIPAPTNHRVVNDPKFKPSKLFPDAGNLELAEMACHEYLGLLWSKLRGRI